MEFSSTSNESSLPVFNGQKGRGRTSHNAVMTELNSKSERLRCPNFLCKIPIFVRYRSDPSHPFAPY